MGEQAAAHKIDSGPESGRDNPMPLTFDITQIDHCSVIITDVERSRRFYRDVLGLKEINKPRTFDFVVLWFDLGNQHLHLLQKARPDTVSARHFALRVTDALAARRYFQGLGMPIEETTPIPGADRFFIYDPDGNRIEIIHWLRPYSSAENARQ
jgi:catechol 2,3-dioxygenase-like lactoylglutathione lyase family enzyme